MKRKVRLGAVVGSLGLLASTAGAALGAAPASAAPSRAQLGGSVAPAATRAHPAGTVAPTARISFDVMLAMPHEAQMRAFARAVSTPGNPQYRHFLTRAQSMARFAPTRAEVATAERWLRSEHFAVGRVAPTRMFVTATGTAAQIEHTFSTSLGFYMVQGHRVRLASGSISVPRSVAATVTGLVGVNQYVNTPALSAGATSPAAAASVSPGQEPPPPAGFRNPQPCSAYWGQKTANITPAAPYTKPLPYDICGYHPSQLRAGYHLAGEVAKGNDGKGVALAIVDAYDSPTILADAQEYFRLNDPAHPLTSSQFSDNPPATTDDQALCAGSGWFDEQALDVEASHTMAPGANIVYEGATDCLDSSLLAALQNAITSGASVVSDSWSDTLGDLFEDSAAKAAFDNTFMFADTNGVSVLYSSGDSGDNFADFGLASTDFPSESPYVTAVGGTSLEVGAHNVRLAEYGWSTANSTLNATTGAWGPLAFQSGGGGGTSYTYTQPYYQAGVVPAALALRNQAVTGTSPMRVIPDISMDADAQTGMLIGLTQTFPDGVYYDQFKEGGTSLASPLLAGVIADAVGLSGQPFGFLNPVLYKADKAAPQGFNDIVAPTNPDATAVIRVDYANTVDASKGYVTHTRAIDYQGPETYCDATGNCATRPVTLTVAPGFDSMTGLGSICGPGFLSELAKL